MLEYLFFFAMCVCGGILGAEIQMRFKPIKKQNKMKINIVDPNTDHPGLCLGLTEERTEEITDAWIEALKEHHKNHEPFHDYLVMQQIAEKLKFTTLEEWVMLAYHGGAMTGLEIAKQEARQPSPVAINAEDFISALQHAAENSDGKIQLKKISDPKEIEEFLQAAKFPKGEV